MTSENQKAIDNLVRVVESGYNNNMTDTPPVDNKLSVEPKTEGGWHLPKKDKVQLASTDDLRKGILIAQGKATEEKDSEKAERWKKKADKGMRELELRGETLTIPPKPEDLVEQAYNNNQSPVDLAEELLQKERDRLAAKEKAEKEKIAKEKRQAELSNMPPEDYMNTPEFTERFPKDEVTTKNLNEPSEETEAKLPDKDKKTTEGDSDGTNINETPLVEEPLTEIIEGKSPVSGEEVDDDVVDAEYTEYDIQPPTKPTSSSIHEKIAKDDANMPPAEDDTRPNQNTEVQGDQTQSPLSDEDTREIQYEPPPPNVFPTTSTLQSENQAPHIPLAPQTRPDVPPPPRSYVDPAVQQEYEGELKRKWNGIPGNFGHLKRWYDNLGGPIGGRLRRTIINQIYNGRVIKRNDI